MAHLVVHCPKCAAKLDVFEESQGKTISCAKCGHRFGIGFHKPAPAGKPTQAAHAPPAAPAPKQKLEAVPQPNSMPFPKPQAGPERLAPPKVEPASFKDESSD